MLNAGFASINISGQWHEFKMKVDANHPRVIVLRRLRCYNRSMRTLVATLTALMLFATTPVAAEDVADGVAAYQAGEYLEAVRIWKPLAEQGDVVAQFFIGLMYDLGMGIPEDDAKATYWWTKAAKQGDARAQFNLCRMYGTTGQGVSQDDAKAIYWRTKAAEQGDAQAQFVIGSMYYHGKSVPQDDARAVYWYTKAAKQGFAEAQFLVGGMYANGRGVSQD